MKLRILLRRPGITKRSSEGWISHVFTAVGLRNNHQCCEGLEIPPPKMAEGMLKQVLRKGIRAHCPIVNAGYSSRKFLNVAIRNGILRVLHMYQSKIQY